MSQSFPISKAVVDRIASQNGIANPGKASIREVRKLVQDIEKETNTRFVKMEMGIPGLPAPQVGVEAQIQALRNGVASIYPEVFGCEMFKTEAARFVKNFLDVEVPAESCIPTVGSMQGAFATFITLTRANPQKNKILFIDPGFPVQKQQCKMLDIPMKAFDVYNYRGEALRAKLDEELRDGDVAAILYSSPNNPAWICFTEEELQIIGEASMRYDTVVIEDDAYFLQDSRHDYSTPGVAPFQPTVAKYTDLFVLLISGSKSFSYAGERIALLCVSPKLFHREYPALEAHYTKTQLQYGRALIFGTLHCLSSGCAHSTQYAMAAMFKAANDGQFNVGKEMTEYVEKAHAVKEMLTENGFYIVYDKDGDELIGDGFYFTFSYPGYTSVDLLNELLRYGISAISLDITGCKLQGIRACISMVMRDQFDDLRARLQQFKADHPVK